MKCEHIKEKIDQFIFEDDLQLDSDLLNHIESCISCKLHYENAVQTKNVFRTISNTQPVLKNPKKLTEDILRNLDISPSDNSNRTNRNKSQAQVLQMFQHFLVAASILLLAVFGIEQYLVVDKVIKLEQKMLKVTTDARSNLNLYSMIRTNPKQVYDYFKKKLDVNGSQRKQSKFSFLVNFTRISYAELRNFKTNQQIPSGNDKIEKSNSSTADQKK